MQLDERELQEYDWFKIEDIKEEYLEPYTRNMILKFREDSDLESKEIYLIKK